MTVVAGRKGSAGVEEVQDADAQDRHLLVRGLLVGVCGTDREIQNRRVITRRMLRRPSTGVITSHGTSYG
jgi:hypothetical protein